MDIIRKLQEVTYDRHERTNLLRDLGIVVNDLLTDRTDESAIKALELIYAENSVVTLLGVYDDDFDGDLNPLITESYPLAIILINNNMYMFVSSDKLLNDFELAKLAVSKSVANYTLVGKELKYNIELYIIACESSARDIIVGVDFPIDNMDFLIEILAYNPNVMMEFSDDLFADVSFYVRILEVCKLPLFYIGDYDGISISKEFAMECIRANPINGEFVSDELKADPEVAKLICSLWPAQYSHLSNYVDAKVLDEFKDVVCCTEGSRCNSCIVCGYTNDDGESVEGLAFTVIINDKSYLKQFQEHVEYFSKPEHKDEFLMYCSTNDYDLEVRDCLIAIGGMVGKPMFHISDYRNYMREKRFSISRVKRVN